MRILAVIVLFGLASEGWAETGISGMIACNRNDKDKKPVIYAFDGEYLMRDNELAYPFQFLASLPNKNEIYFAYTHGKFHTAVRDEKARQAEWYLSRLTEYGITETRLQRVHKHCVADDEAFQRNLYTLASKIGGSVNDYGSIIIPSRNLTFSCEDIVTLDSKELVNLIPFPPVTIEELTYVKLTLNLSSMIVIEERYEPEPTNEQAYLLIEKTTKFSGEEYQCQSLGITAPKIDTSQSLTPIGKDL